MSRAVVLVCFAGFLLAGCLGKSGQPAHQSSAEARFLRAYRPYLRRTGVDHAVAACYLTKATALPVSFFDRLGGQGLSRQRMTFERLKLRFRDCVPSVTPVPGPNLPVPGPNLPATAINEARKSLKENLPVLLRQPGQSATNAQIRCMVGQVDKLSANELRMLWATRGLGAQTTLRKLALGCGGH